MCGRSRRKNRTVGRVDSDESQLVQRAFGLLEALKVGWQDDYDTNGTGRESRAGAPSTLSLSDGRKAKLTEEDT